MRAKHQQYCQQNKRLHRTNFVFHRIHKKQFKWLIRQTIKLPNLVILKDSAAFE